MRGEGTRRRTDARKRKNVRKNAYNKQKIDYFPCTSSSVLTQTSIPPRVILEPFRTLLFILASRYTLVPRLVALTPLLHASPS